MKPKGLTPEEARKILDKNPALRASGKDTSWVLERANKAWKDEEQKKSADDFLGAIAQTRAAMKREQARLEERIAELKKELDGTKQKAVVHLYAWLEEHDPKISGETQEAIADQAAFLKDLGFSLDQFHKR